jgi:RsiW-degrading membrane proteinase PrsW (M82 family)
MNLETLSIIFGFLPGIVWLFFYLKEDPRPEPKYLIFLTFISGGISAIFAFLIQTFTNQTLKDYDLLPLNENSSLGFIITLFIFYAFVEEIAKFLFTYLTVFKNKNFDEPVDAMIYMIVNALGFATLENIGILTNNEIVQGTFINLIEITSFRFIGATLLHTLTSGIIGYFWALSIRKFNYKIPLILGIFLATILHTLFNLFIIIFGNNIITFLFLIIIGMFLLVDFEKLKYKKI